MHGGRHRLRKISFTRITNGIQERLLTGLPSITTTHSWAMSTISCHFRNRMTSQESRWVPNGECPLKWSSTNCWRNATGFLKRSMALLDTGSRAGSTTIAFSFRHMDIKMVLRFQIRVIVHIGHRQWTPLSLLMPKPCTVMNMERAFLRISPVALGFS